MEQKQFEKEKRDFEDQILLWSEKHSYVLKNLPEKFEECHFQLKTTQKLLEASDSKVEMLSDELRDVQVSLLKTQYINTKLQKENEQLRTHFISQKKLLEYQNQLSTVKLEAVESKYRNLKLLYIGLERLYIELEATKAHKHKHTSKNK